MSQIFFPSRLEKECAQKPLEASPELAEMPTSLPQKNIALKEMLMKFQGREKPGRRGHLGRFAVDFRKVSAEEKSWCNVAKRNLQHAPCISTARCN